MELMRINSKWNKMKEFTISTHEEAISKKDQAFPGRELHGMRSERL